MENNITFLPNEFVEYKGQLCQIVKYGLELCEISFSNYNNNGDRFYNNEIVEVKTSDLHKIHEVDEYHKFYTNFNIYEILEPYKDKELYVYSVSLQKMIQVVDFIDEIIYGICGSDKVYYNKFGYRIDIDTEEILTAGVDIYPDTKMSRWSSYKFSENNETETDKLCLRKYITNRVGSFVFSDVCGKSQIVSVDNDTFGVISHVGRDEYIFDFYGYYHGSKCSELWDNPVCNKILIRPNEDESLTWDEWFNNLEYSRWRASSDDYFYFINEFLEVEKQKECYLENQTKLWNIGNYFNSERDALSKVYDLQKEFKN